jgi:hypothetical protein
LYNLCKYPVVYLDGKARVEKINANKKIPGLQVKLHHNRFLHVFSNSLSATDLSFDAIQSEQMTVLLNKPEINTYTTLVLIQVYHTVQHKYAVTRFIFDNSILM